MKKAYIILAHKNPSQLLRLVKTLDDGHSYFYIHIDKRVDINRFIKVWNYSSQVVMVKRENTGWASFGLIDATLNALKAAAESHIHFEMVTLLSGEDYPIKSNEDIDRFFRDSYHRLFVEHFELPDYGKWENGGGLYRVNKYFLGFGINKIAAKTINFVGLFLPLLRRKYESGIKPYWGSQWWSIDMHSVKYILKYVQKNPSFSKFHRFTFAPDEVFFQTILLNADDEHIRMKIKNDSMRFMIWEDGASAHPKVLRRADLQKIVKSDRLFARKFDMEKDEEILNMIDRDCLNVHNNAERA